MLSPERSGRLDLFPALLARDVLVRAGQLAAADVAEQLLEDGQLTPAGRGLALVHGHTLAVIEAKGADFGHQTRVIEGDFRHRSLGHLCPVVGVFLGDLADVVPDLVRFVS